MLSNTPPEITKEISLIPITGAKLASLINAALTVGATVPDEIYLMQTDFINGDNSFMHVVKEITGGVYLYHGSVFKGHLHIPAEMKGAVLYGKDKAYVTDAVTTKMQERGFKVKWTEKPLRASQAYFHPIFQATLLEEFGAPYEKVLEWKEKHLTPECAASPRPAPGANRAELPRPPVAQADQLPPAGARPAALRHHRGARASPGDPHPGRQARMHRVHAPPAPCTHPDIVVCLRVRRSRLCRSPPRRTAPSQRCWHASPSWRPTWSPRTRRSSRRRSPPRRQAWPARRSSMAPPPRPRLPPTLRNAPARRERPHVHADRVGRTPSQAMPPTA